MNCSSYNSALPVCTTDLCLMSEVTSDIELEFRNRPPQPQGALFQTVLCCFKGREELQ